jgi:hypothetical protein
MSFIVPFLPLIAAGVGAAGIGTSIYEGDKSREAAAAQLKQEQQAAASQANLAKQEAVLGASGQTQQQTGGSLTDPGTAALTDLLAGYPGFQSGSTSTGVGVGSSGVSNGTTATSAGGASATPNIASILSLLQGGNTNSGGGLGLGSSPTSTISGGNWQSQPTQPQSQFELANPVV